MPIGIGRPAKHRRTDFGERLAQARESAGLTQLQLADQLGTTQRVITYWERGSVALRADQLKALADALGVTADFLLGREQPKARGIGPTGKMRQLSYYHTASGTWDTHGDNIPPYGGISKGLFDGKAPFLVLRHRAIIK